MSDSLNSTLWPTYINIGWLINVHSLDTWLFLQYLTPFVEKEKYNISRRCRLHPDNDIYRDQEQHKSHIDINEWKCGYCKKIFYEEKHLDQHFDNRHSNLLNLVWCFLSNRINYQCNFMFSTIIDQITSWWKNGKTSLD